MTPSAPSWTETFARRRGLWPHDAPWNGPEALLRALPADEAALLTDVHAADGLRVAAALHRPGRAQVHHDVLRALGRPDLPSWALRTATPVTLEAVATGLDVSTPDVALALAPTHVPVLDSRRLNAFHRYGTLHLVLGEEALRIDEAHHALLARHAQGGPPPADTPLDTRFTRDGDLFRLRDDLYFHPTPSLLDADLALAFYPRSGTGQAVRIPLDATSLAPATSLIARLRRTVPAAEAAAELDAGQARLLDALLARGLVVQVPRLADRRLGEARVDLVAHSALLFSTPTHRVLLDPLLTVRDRPRFDPLHHVDAPVDAVVISHAHWDHFNLDGLLHVPRNARVILPAHRHADSLANPDMARCVRELGFHDVVELAPFERVDVGDITLTALPFHGETQGPESPRDAMTLHARLGGGSVVALVDAADDPFGRMDDVLREVRSRLGPADLLFAPGSGFSTPRTHWSRRPFVFDPEVDPYTGGPDDVVRWAGILEARRVIPYALFHTQPSDVDTDAIAAEGDALRAGSLKELAARMAAWPDGPLTVLRPGEGLALGGAAPVDASRATQG
jgi:L-ascorbate metabolism protein UlaG (beta-lactamase superfamily)